MNIMTSRLVRTVLYVGAAALILNFARAQLPRVRAQISSTSGYTVVLAEQTTRHDGQRKLASLQTWATRSDGATVLKLGPEGLGSRTIRLPSGIVIEANDVMRRKTTVNLNLAPGGFTPQHHRRDANASCAAGHPNETFVAEEMLGQHRVAKFTESAGGRKATNVYALDHQCALVGSLVEFEGEEGEKSEVRLVALIPGAPSATFFEVPADYKEGPPSVINGDNLSAPCDANCQQRRQRRDEQYFLIRAR